VIHATATLRAWLLAQSGVTALCGLNIFGDTLPEHYDPTSNPAIVVSLKAGAGHAEISTIMEVDLQVKCWAGINQFATALAVYGAVYDAIHSKSMASVAGQATVLTCYEGSTAQPMADPDTGWATSVGSFHLILRQDS
jgi:hypothetical protein